MNPHRYDRPSSWFRRCGRSGLKLPAISLGFWHNFGAAGTASHRIAIEAVFHEHARKIVHTAFDLGITHFDFANNYGPPPGAAEERCGSILRELPRGEFVVASKAGYQMWPGPYGDGGSRKYLVQSCDASLKRLQVDHLDIFYHHRPDPHTPLEESLAALDYIVRSGRALYVGISSYSGSLSEEAMRICERERFVKPIIHQPKYNMFNRGIETDLLPVAGREGLGLICFSPLAQGLLTEKYIDGIPTDSRAATAGSFLKEGDVNANYVEKARQLREVARARNQTLAQMAISWILRHSEVCSALIGASRPEQVSELAAAADAPAFSSDELDLIETILRGCK